MFDEVYIFDEQDIGCQKRIAEGKEVDYAQLAREKIYICFIKCFVPFKKKYEFSEFNRIISTALIYNARKWNKCVDGLVFSSDIEYWIDLLKFYTGAKYNGKVIDLSKVKPWNNILNKELINDSPVKLLNKIYKANCFMNWDNVPDNVFAYEIFNIIRRRTAKQMKGSNNYKTIEYINLAITFAECMDLSIQYELNEFKKRLVNEKQLVLNELISSYHNVKKIKMVRKNTCTSADNKYIENTELIFLKMYDNIVHKNIYY